MSTGPALNGTRPLLKTDHCWIYLGPPETLCGRQHTETFSSQPNSPPTNALTGQFNIPNLHKIDSWRLAENHFTITCINSMLKWKSLTHCTTPLRSKMQENMIPQHYIHTNNCLMLFTYRPETMLSSGCTDCSAHIRTYIRTYMCCVLHVKDYYYYVTILSWIGKTLE